MFCLKGFFNCILHLLIRLVLNFGMKNELAPSAKMVM